MKRHEIMDSEPCMHCRYLYNCSIDRMERVVEGAECPDKVREDLK